MSASGIPALVGVDASTKYNARSIASRMPAATIATMMTRMKMTQNDRVEEVDSKCLQSLLLQTKTTTKTISTIKKCST
jgi:hypothetical protein